MPLASTSVDARPLDDHGTVRVEHDHVAAPDRRASDLDRFADRAGHGLLRTGHTHEARPDRQSDVAQLLDVAHGCVHEDRSDAASLRLRRQQLADERHRRRLGHRQHEHLAGLRLSDGRMHHEVVVLAAPNGPRRPGDTRARQNLDQRHVDHGRASGRLVDRRAPQLRQLGEDVGHNALTTCGVTRWNASAYRIAESPDERRAWLPRCSPRCV